MTNPRYTEHGPSVRQTPPTFKNPKKRLSHAVKAGPSTLTRGRSWETFLRRVKK